MSPSETPIPERKRPPSRALEFWTALERAHAVVQERVARAASRFDLTPSEYGALEVLGRRGPMVLGDLQQQILVSSGGVTYLVDRLSARGLVTRRPNPDDRRARFAVLTERGEELLAQIVPAHERAVSDAVDRLTRGEQHQAANLLLKLGLRLSEERHAVAPEADLAPESVGQAQPVGKAAGVRAPRQVVVVDDDPRTAESARAALGPAGCEIVWVRTAAAAEAALPRHDVALIVLAVVLPDGDGRNVEDSLRRRTATAGIPVVMVGPGGGDRVGAERPGPEVTAWLEKPVDPATLLEAADAALNPKSGPATTHTDPGFETVGRAGLHEAYERQVRSRRGDAPPATLALLDWDEPSAIDRSLGSDARDAILRQAGRRVAEALRSEDVLARWRDDDLVVLFPRTPPTTAAQLLKGAQSALAAAPPVAPDGREIRLTFSAGVTAAAPPTTLDEAIAAADGALCGAAAGGRGRIVTAGDDAGTTPIRVLLAEGDRAIAALARNRLQRSGFDVVECRDGTAALSLAETGEFGAIVSDVRMAGIDGLELVRRVRETARHRATPIVMLTSVGREEEVEQARSVGANDYVTKPFSPVELLARVQRLLRRRVRSSDS